MCKPTMHLRLLSHIRMGIRVLYIYMYLAESVRHQFEFKLEIYVSELVPHWFDVRGRSSSTIKVVLLVHSL